MITKFLAVTIEFYEMADDHVIVANFSDVGDYIKAYWNDENIKSIILEPVCFYKKGDK